MCVCVCVCEYLHAGNCASVSVFVCMAKDRHATGLISRDLWALTGCRLVSTATSKGWRCFTYPGGALHPCPQRHVEHRGSQPSRRWEVPVWSWEWKRGQLTISVAWCLWWVHEPICGLLKLKYGEIEAYLKQKVWPVSNSYDAFLLLIKFQTAAFKLNVKGVIWNLRKHSLSWQALHEKIDS